MFPYSPAILITAMKQLAKNIYLVSQDGLLNAHHYAENRLKIGQYLAAIFQNRGGNIEHAEFTSQSIASDVPASQEL